MNAELMGINCRFEGDEMNQQEPDATLIKQERDKAIEYGTYLAERAEKYIDAVNRHAALCGEGGHVMADDIVDAELAINECYGRLRMAIFQFKNKFQP